MNFWRRFHRNEKGATTIEYCVVMFFIITACLVGITALGSSSNGLWGRNTTRLESYL